MNTRKNAAAQSIVLACALTVTACAGGASPPDPTESSSPVVQESKTTTPSPSPTKPEYEPATAKGPAKNVPKPQMPELAKKQNEEGAIAFVKHYFEVMNYSLATYTTTDLTDITSKDCRVCGVNFIDHINLQSERNYWQVDGKYNVRVHGVKINEDNEGILSFTTTINSATVYSDPNAIVVKGAAVTDPVQGVAILRWDKNWKMFDMSFTE